MRIVSNILVAIVALEHLYILVLEMFLWTSPRALRVFSMSMEVAEASKPLAANQGIYNGFLAAGLLWSLLHPNAHIAKQIQLFFLICVIVAAIAGAILANPSILIVQGAPAVLALLAVLLTRPKASEAM